MHKKKKYLVSDLVLFLLMLDGDLLCLGYEYDTLNKTSADSSAALEINLKPGIYTCERYCYPIRTKEGSVSIE